MKLVGMLESPYVRRTLISARLLEVPLEVQALSVLQHYAEFHRINPMVRAPTLILDEGGQLMESALIVQHFEDLAHRSLYPQAPGARLRCLQLSGVALVLMDKAVQLYHELDLRPPACRWDDWITRITAQLQEAARQLECDCPDGEGWLCDQTPSHADVCVVVAWQFTHAALPHLLDRHAYPRLERLLQRAAAHPAFS